ncbi:hypothetical protein J3L18_11595 [Mucilaginibacter gossypii]|uniref:hypothetical protein n=1 Tax=Mucilaginibacter gossypii TaxID=551996 RepID=UPI000DCC8EB0|nr:MULTISPECIES: hypothetical protein [Mucilaginibacter]QTE39663.1 hypothetical protein J3L18_11595 [Mucilaginibacter gossypii]RAV54042.1 hypothetical protein DIU36_22165 [Mucilaginibacter rubeus]
MKKQLILLLTILLPGTQQKIRVNERLSAIEIEKHFPLPSADRIIHYKKHHYLIKTSEIFDEDGSLNAVSFLKSEGWLEFKRDEFSKLKNFLEENDLKPKLACQVIGKKSIKINNDTIVYDSLNDRRHIIYYFKKNDHKRLFILKF